MKKIEYEGVTGYFLNEKEKEDILNVLENAMNLGDKHGI